MFDIYDDIFTDLVVVFSIIFEVTKLVFAAYTLNTVSTALTQDRTEPDKDTAVGTGMFILINNKKLYAYIHINIKNGESYMFVGFIGFVGFISNGITYS